MKKIAMISALLLPFAAMAQSRMQQRYDYDGSYGMMGFGGGMHGGLFGIWSLVMSIGFVLWLIVGGLLVVWLWQQINKK
jgi:uncharacterized membrane protein